MSAPRPMGEQVLEALRRRASAKEHDYDFSRTVEPAKIEAVLEAGRWAPSAHQEVPITAVRNSAFLRMRVVSSGQ